MIVTGNLPAGEAPSCPPGTRLLAAIDVEWSKNYRVKDGNVPFCFSVAWLPSPAATPPSRTRPGSGTPPLTSKTTRERGDLITAASSALECLSPATQA